MEFITEAVNQKGQKYINLIQRLIKKGKPLFGKIKMRKDEIRVSYAKISKVKKEFGWSPSVSIRSGLLKLLDLMIIRGP